MVAIGLGIWKYNFPRNFITAHVLKMLCGVQQKKKKHAIFGTEFKLSSVPCYYDVDVGLLNY